MAEASDIVDRRALMPIAFLLLLVVAGALISFGPGRKALATARADADEKARRITDWEQQSGVAPVVSVAERKSWQQEYERFEAIAVPGRDEASLMGYVANVMAAPSVSGLEMTPLSGDEPNEGDSLPAREPFGTREFQLTRLPMRVRFDVQYADLFPILARLKSRAHGLVLTKAEFQRHFPGVRVDLELDLWVRREVTS